MWTVLVVVPGVLSRYLSQLPPAEDQRVVKALAPQLAHKPPEEEPPAATGPAS
jgi:hypothetical protein